MQPDTTFPENVVQNIAPIETAVAEVATEQWYEPASVYIPVQKQLKKKKDPPPSVIIPPAEITIVKSTYDPSIGGKNHPNPNLRDYTLNPTFQLIYKIVPGWYTKAKSNPKNTSFYGEGPTDALLKKYRQKFWDEIIEAPNDTGQTDLNTAEKIQQRLEEIGDRYKNLGSYDTWTPTTGIPSAMYPSYDGTAGGSETTLPKAP